MECTYRCSYYIQSCALNLNSVVTFCYFFLQSLENTFGGLLNGKKAVIAVPPREKLLLTLWTLANNESFREIGDRFGMSRGNAHCLFALTVSAIAGEKDRHIVWPSMAAQASLACAAETAGIPGCVGFVDGCHIPIKKPHENGDDYINRKGWPSMLLQGVCDVSLRFINVVTGWPGSVHDYRVFKLSKLGIAINSKPDTVLACSNYHLLGDSAYVNSQGVLTPFKDNGHLEHKHKRYNKCHSSQRSRIERSFGRLKVKFRRLKVQLDMDNIKLMCDVIVCACILHNIIILNGCDIENDDTAEDDELAAPTETDSVQLQFLGNQKRDTIMNSLMG